MTAAEKARAEEDPLRRASTRFDGLMKSPIASKRAGGGRGRGAVCMLLSPFAWFVAFAQASKECCNNGNVNLALPC